MRVLQVCARYQYFYNIWAQQPEAKYQYTQEDFAGYRESLQYQQWIETMRRQSRPDMLNPQSEKAFLQAIVIRGDVFPSMQPIDD